MLPAVPPAQIQEVPTRPDRNLVVPGFHGVGLNASVRPGLAHPCFAVMVADSGPTDRDWSSPLLRDPRYGTILPSHGGRDFADWLQKQGIGSLRYDKRFVGSQDPRLDISLDAQVGDLRAVLKAARLLPEAQGKRILLVGHGEGALLSLMASTDADALLLLNMPGQSQARAITEQLRQRLPLDTAKANLAYLDAIFQAIRVGGPVPATGKEVHPSMAALAKSLMAPESLGFVKATLDVDPWALASKLAVPCALAWGGKDAQNPKPEKIPTSYRGRIIDLPDANHLLKREDRVLASPPGPEALLNYGDSTPMADLSPLADWLKEWSAAGGQ
jgi:pimeloyl-ACP methyl ester carboxylesterase